MNHLTPTQQANSGLPLPADICLMIFQPYTIAEQASKSENSPRESYRGYQTTPTDRMELRSLRIPRIAEVSKLMHSMYLQSYFYDGRFTITVGPWANPNSHPVEPSWLLSDRALDLFVAKRDAANSSDLLLLSERVAALLKKYDGDAVFRDVEFRLHWVSTVPNASIQVATVALMWHSRKLHVEERVLRSVRRGRAVDGSRTRTREKIVKPAVELARTITGREDFKGFTVKDLRQIADELRNG